MTDAECRNEVIDRLRSVGLEKKDHPSHDGLRRASVLVPLFERSADDVVASHWAYESNIHVLFTQRPKTMKSHGGEVRFPGGKQDPEDGGDDVKTALRETHEEIGIHSDYIRHIARMETVLSKHSLVVTPVVGLIDPPSVAEPSQLKLNTDEVEAAFAVPLEYFALEENCDSVTKVEGRDFLLRTYLYDDPESGATFRIWGLTAHVVHEIAKLGSCK